VRAVLLAIVAALTLVACEDPNAPLWATAESVIATADSLNRAKIAAVPTENALWYRVQTAYAEPAPTAVTMIDLNNATADVLDGLPGIGPTLAQRIIDGRGTAGYATLDDLSRVQGIGPSIIAQIRACACTVQE
jgi:competence ComEA-like helix-hairpin-helix protein